MLDRLPAGSAIVAAFSRGLLTLGLYISRGEASRIASVYERLREDAEAIEREIGAPLHWDFVENRLRQQVWTSRPVDRQDARQLEDSRTWVIAMAKKFKSVFESRLSELADA